MNIQWTFHALAVLSGIVAASCGFLSSQNKLTLFIVFSLVAAVFELSIPFLKIKPLDEPNAKFSLINLPTNYQKGVIVDGIEWQPDYKQYILKFKNESTASTMSDLRIDIDLNGGIVQKKIEIQEGCESVSLSQASISDLGIGKMRSISKTQ